MLPVNGPAGSGGGVVVRGALGGAATREPVALGGIEAMAVGVTVGSGEGIWLDAVAVGGANASRVRGAGWSGRRSATTNPITPAPMTTIARLNAKIAFRAPSDNRHSQKPPSTRVNAPAARDSRNPLVSVMSWITPTTLAAMANAPASQLPQRGRWARSGSGSRCSIEPEDRTGLP